MAAGSPSEPTAMRASLGATATEVGSKSSLTSGCSWVALISSSAFCRGPGRRVEGGAWREARLFEKAAGEARDACPAGLRERLEIGSR